MSLISAGGVKLSSNCGLKSFCCLVGIFSGFSIGMVVVGKVDITVTAGMGLSFSVFVAGSTCICWNYTISKILVDEIKLRG